MPNTDYSVIPLSDIYEEAFRSMTAEYLPGSDLPTIFEKISAGECIVLLMLQFL